MQLFFGTVLVTMQPKSQLLLELIDSIASLPGKLMHLKVFGCYMHGTLKTWSVHPPQPKQELKSVNLQSNTLFAGAMGQATR